MLRENVHVSQMPGETHRRWFSSERFDLIVWQDPGCPLVGFQLCYRIAQKESVLTWTRGEGYSHGLLDNGEHGGMGFKMAPTVMPDGNFIKDEVLRHFSDESTSLDPDISEVIVRKLQDHE